MLFDQNSYRVEMASQRTIFENKGTGEQICDPKNLAERLSQKTVF